LPKTRFSLLEALVKGVEPTLCRCHLAGDASLFGFQKVKWDGLGIVSVEKFLTLVAEPSQLSVLHIALMARNLLELTQFFENEVPNLRDLIVRQLDAAVEIDDPIFGGFDPYSSLRARRPFLMPS